MAVFEQDLEHLISVVATGTVKPVLLLGAGASVRSGIPATDTFVERAAAWVYAKRKQISPEDVRIMRSDWLPFLENFSWYNANKSPGENYPAVFKHLLAPREIRREFYSLILKPQVPPSIGYAALADLVAKKHFDTVLTTNFDNILQEVFKKEERIHTIDVIKSTSDYSKITSYPRGVQIIHLHGDIDNYTDKNDIDEIQTLDTEFVQHLKPLLSDHPLIVIGYRGWENSIMKRLFIENASYSTNYKHGIYWCVREQDDLTKIPDNLEQLSALIGNNLQFVRIKDFDELFEVNLRKGIKPQYKLTYTRRDGGAENIFDLKAVSGAAFSDLEYPLVKQRIPKYCDVLKISLNPDATDNDLQQVMLERDLLVQSDGIIMPTNSGMLLFGKEPQRFLDSVKIQVNILDENGFFQANVLGHEEAFRSEYSISGNVWTQLNEIIEIVSLFNKPFKLKSDLGETVTPYSPLAVRELLTNCIVHRDYENSSATIIDITPKFIKIRNAGGLVDEVKDRLEGEEIEDVIKKGTKGIKGYRNPVLADLFYGTETMEKRGSGLADVFEESRRYSSHVKFGPNIENNIFEATIYARPEIIDEVTNTAKKSSQYLEQYLSNIVGFESVPKKLFLADLLVTRIELLDAIPFEIWPPFVISENKLLTFFDPSDKRFGFSDSIDSGTITTLSLEEYVDSDDSNRRVMELLNKSVISHLSHLGLYVDRQKKRAFFKRDILREENVQIKYQARIKSATRTVVKRRVSLATGKVVYWEHKSMSFRVERFQTRLAVLISPNYSFTIDGLGMYIKADKINILSTKRASRDYNSNYINDIAFWHWVLSSGKKSFVELIQFPRELDALITPEQRIVLSNEFARATVPTEELFEDIADGWYDSADDVYDEVDEIALSKESDTTIPDQDSSDI